MRTHVCITVDVEFSVGGAFAKPEQLAPVGERRVTCPVNGKEHGLGFILDVLAAARLPATFFVEALNPAYFGYAEMGRQIDRILTAGQDAQMHLHPCWLAFRNPDWRKAVRQCEPNDSCAGRGTHELAEFIGSGLKAFQAWGAPRPVAVRTGSLKADAAVYRAMADFDLRLASNLGIGAYRPDDHTLLLNGGRRRIHGVMEAPVLTYADLSLGGRPRERVLTVTGSSWPEMRALLWAARRRGVSPVVILTHPFEFVKTRDHQCTKVFTNVMNQARFLQLCSFLNTHQGEFQAISFGSAAELWLEESEEEAPLLSPPFLPMLQRVIENGVNDRIFRN
jgi:hypothetical protein